MYGVLCCACVQYKSEVRLSSCDWCCCEIEKIVEARLGELRLTLFMVTLPSRVRHVREGVGCVFGVLDVLGGGWGCVGRGVGCVGSA